MSQAFHAIYENGVLRPITPLNLPESAEVTGILQERNGTVEDAPDDPLLGLMSDEPELVDAIVEEAMQARELHPLRTDG